MQNYPHQIIGYHSCDYEVGMSVLKGEDDLLSSQNSWDWLGHGVYFWEDNPLRAYEYAKEVSEKVQINNKGINKPFVLGSIIQLGKCLNLLSPDSAVVLKNAYKLLEDYYKKANLQMPKNQNANRALDCQIIRLALEIIKQSKGIKNYDSVRAAFYEGEEIYPGSNFSVRSHIQVCIINPKCIKGYFIPRPLKLFNPYIFK